MRWILACDCKETHQAMGTAVSNSGSGATLHTCPVDQASDQVARTQPDLVLLAPGGAIERHLAWIAEVVEVAACDVLVIGTASEARTVIQVLDAGVARFVDRNDLDTSLPAALAAVAKMPGKATHRGRVICVAGAGSGSGASTIVANLAVAMNRGSRNSIAVDLRLEGGDLASLLDIQARHSIADFCEQESR
ncbi:MAG: hypothetical protein HKN47_13545, partial [Pirellulaceae bacterium]|nr:hypothetical protein [Pirellulaceae bacterium]